MAGQRRQLGRPPKGLTVHFLTDSCGRMSVYGMNALLDKRCGQILACRVKPAGDNWLSVIGWRAWRQRAAAAA